MPAVLAFALLSRVSRAFQCRDSNFAVSATMVDHEPEDMLASWTRCCSCSSVPSVSQHAGEHPLAVGDDEVASRSLPTR
jgi:hypothetical protein